MRHFAALLVLLGVACAARGYKVLGVFPMPMHSHYRVASALLKELAARGHDVTVINPYPQRPPLPNYRDVSVAEIVGPINEHKSGLYGLEDADEFTCVRYLTAMGMTLTRATLEHPNVQALLRSGERFDVVLVAQFMNEAHMAIAQHFDAPLVLVATMPLFSWTNFLLANPAPPSYVPNLLGRFSGEMGFWQRLVNALYDAAAIAYHQFVLLPQHRELARRLIPSRPELDRSLHNVSLVLVNADEAIYDAVAASPHVKQVGGLHVHPPPSADRLPAELRAFLDAAADGVVVFSMGSNLKSADLPPAKVRQILAAFAKLRQKVLWKWEDADLPGQPPNVRIMKWLPQQDVLAHPNVRAFISHGGLLSTIESIYHGIPIIGMPIFTDQKMNVATSVAKGYALALPLRDLNEERLTWALNEILHNPQYRDNAQARSRILRDHPQRPVEAAVFWVEYVVRHGGAPHLRHAGTRLYWFQRHLLDVAAVLLLGATLALALACAVVRKVGRLACGRRNAAPTTAKTKTQ